MTSLVLISNNKRLILSLFSAFLNIQAGNKTLSVRYVIHPITPTNLVDAQ